MKCRYKTNKPISAVKETEHTVTTAQGKMIHKKLASNRINFQPSKKPEDIKKPTMRCKRCGRFSNGEFCRTHQRLMMESNRTADQPCSSKTLPIMPSRECTVIPYITVISDNNSVSVEEIPNTVESEPEIIVTTEEKCPDGSNPPTADHQSPAMTETVASPVGCSTERTSKGPISDNDNAPSTLYYKSTTVGKGIVDIGLEGGGEEIETIQAENGVRRID